MKEVMKLDLEKRTKNDMFTYQLASVVDPSTKALVQTLCDDIKERLVKEAKGNQAVTVPCPGGLQELQHIHM